MCPEGGGASMTRSSDVGVAGPGAIARERTAERRWARSSLAPRARLPAPPRHGRRAGAAVRALGAPAGHLRRAGRAGRVRVGHHAAHRAPRGVPADRRVDRHRPQGDVRLRGQGWATGRGAPRRSPPGSCGPSPSTTRPCRGRRGPPEPNFRYEAPQAARYRQHFQVDAEIVGTDDPDADVEVIALLDGFHRALGLTQRRLVVNSLGDDASRAAYLAALTAYLQTNAADLTEQSRETLALNPLRVLDSRRPEDQPVVAATPQVLGYLTPDRGALRSGAGG